MNGYNGWTRHIFAFVGRYQSPVLGVDRLVLAIALPKTNPNRQHLVEVIDDFEDDIDVEDNRKVRHSRSIWKYDLGWTDRRQRADLDAGVVDSQ